MQLMYRECLKRITNTFQFSGYLFLRACSPPTFRGINPANSQSGFKLKEKRDNRRSSHLI